MIPRRIQTTDLPAAVRGYDRAATDRLLQEVATDYEEIWLERKALREQVEQLEAEIAALREQERHVAEALLSAERTAQDIRTTAEREAEALVANARSEREHLETVIGDLRNLVERVRSDIANFLAGTLDQLGVAGAGDGIRERSLVDELVTRPRAVE